jgi:hypothetical protein
MVIGKLKHEVTIIPKREPVPNRDSEYDDVQVPLDAPQVPAYDQPIKYN